MSSKASTYGALVLLILIWGTTWAAVRVGLEGIPPFTGIALRFAIASLVLLVVGKLLHLPLETGSRARTLWVVNAVLSFSVSYGVVYWAQQWVPSGLAAVLFSTFPFFVAVMAHFWLPGERLDLRSALGIATGFLGVVVIFSEDLAGLAGVEIRLAAAVFLVSPLISAVANVIIKRWGGGVSALSLTAVPMGMTAVMMGTLAALVERGREIRLDPASVGSLLYLAIPGTAITFFLYFWLLARVRATRLSLITYSVPIIAVLVGTTWLDEPFTPRMLVGALLVLAGVTLTLRTTRRA